MARCEAIASYPLRNIRYRFEGSNCGTCGNKHFPPREVCPDCGAVVIVESVNGSGGRETQIVKVLKAPESK